MGDNDLARRFDEAGRMGAYLRIITEGVVAPDDPVEVISRPSHSVTLRSGLDALGDRERLRALLRVPELPAFWRRLPSVRRWVEKPSDSRLPMVASSR